MITIRPLTREDIPTIQATARGWAVVLDDTVVGTAGVVYTDGLQAWSELDPVMKKYPKIIMRLAHKVRDLCRQMNGPVYALADDQYERSGKLLEHIGFVHEEGPLYRWGN